MVSSASGIGRCISDSPNWARSKAAPTADGHVRLTSNRLSGVDRDSSKGDLAVRRDAGWAARKAAHTKELPGARVAGQIIEDGVALVGSQRRDACLADLGVHQLDLRLPHRSGHRARIVGAMALSTTLHVGARGIAA